MRPKTQKRKPSGGDGPSKKRQAISDGGSNPRVPSEASTGPPDPPTSKTDQEEKKWRSCYPSIAKEEKENETNDSSEEENGTEKWIEEENETEDCIEEENEAKDWIAVPLTGKHAAPGETFMASKIDEKLALSCKWQKTPKGYPRSKKYGYFHCAIFGGKLKGLQIDHIHWNKLDCRRKTLRKVTASVNSFNKKISARNTSGCAGVRLERNSWVARIGVGNKIIYLGAFKTKEEAILARKAAEITYYGSKLEESTPETFVEDNRHHYKEGNVGFLAITGAQGIKQKLFATISLEDFEKCRKVKWCLQDGYPFNNAFGKLSRYVKNYKGPLFIDHRDGDPLNNQRENLRKATVSQNNMNTCLASNNTSGVKGVRFDKERQKWIARIVINGKEINLGRFAKKEDAVKARKEAEELLHREWARGASTTAETKLSSGHSKGTNRASSDDEEDGARQISNAAVERIIAKIAKKRNKHSPRRNKSGVKGVRWNKERRLWTAIIGVNGKKIYLGAFTKKEDAIKARKDAEKK
jgi:hypothetical protein